MTLPVIIIGAGGHAAVVADALLASGHEVLGCTELPFVASQEDTRVPLFDTTALHAQRALELAVGVRRLPPARPRKDRRPFRRARGGPESDRMGRR